MTVTFGRLPRMEPGRGASWGQPAGLRDRVKVFATHATIGEGDWLELSNYRSSMPSGVYAGKVWRCGPWLCWYGRPRKIVERGREIEVCSNGCVRALVTGDGVNMTPARRRVWLG